MFVSDVLKPNHPIRSSALYLIRTKCSQYLSESNNKPIFKRLDWRYGAFAKVKVRHSPTYKTNQILDEAFGESIESTLVPVTSQPLDVVTESDDWFYMFPVNGYKFLYSTQIVDYRYQADKLMFKSNDRDLVVDTMRESYIHNTGLVEGIDTCVELLLYNMPSFYVVSCSRHISYSSLLSSIRQS